MNIRIDIQIPSDISLILGGDIHALCSGSDQTDSLRLERNIDLERISAIVVNHPTNPRLISCDEEARRLQFDEERFGADQFTCGLSHATINRRGARVGYPRG